MAETGPFCLDFASLVSCRVEHRPNTCGEGDRAAPGGLRSGTHSAILYLRSGGMQCGSCHNASVGINQSARRRSPPGVFVFSSAGVAARRGFRTRDKAIVRVADADRSAGYAYSSAALLPLSRFPRPQYLPYFTPPASVRGGKSSTGAPRRFAARRVLDWI